MRKILSSKILMRIFCACGVLVILVCCAAPAFALGEGYGANRFVTIPFDYYVVSGYGGPLDFLGAKSRVGTQLNNTVYDANAPYDEFAYTYVSCTSNSLSATTEMKFTPASGSTSTTSIAFTMNEDLYVKGSGFKFRVITSDMTITSVRVYGDYYSIVDDYGTHPASFEYRYFESIILPQTSNSIDFSNVINSALPASIQNDPYVYFGNLTVQIYVRNSGTEDTIRFVTSADGYTMNTIPYPPMGWVNGVLNSAHVSPAPITNELDVATLLGDSVGSFFGVEIFPDFTLGHLFGISLTLGVLFFGLKMIV